MARARNIKHAFFMNDQLAEKNCALGRLFFIGLWTLADYKGDLEWRPGRLKAQILPYDECDINKIAINLDKSGFVRFYSDGEKIYLNVVNFIKHQNPHKNEKDAGSDIPAYSNELRQVVDLNTLTINPDKSRLNPEQYETNPADSLILIPEDKLSKGAQTDFPDPLDFDEHDQPDNSGNQSSQSVAADSCTGEQLQFTEQHLLLARTTGLGSEYSDSDIQTRFDLFRCYKANANTLKTQSEWLSNWRTWCQREKVNHAKQPNRPTGNGKNSAQPRNESGTQRAMRLAQEAAERLANNQTGEGH